MGDTRSAWSVVWPAGFLRFQGLGSRRFPGAAGRCPASPSPPALCVPYTRDSSTTPRAGGSQQRHLVVMRVLLTAFPVLRSVV